jgi:phosphoribosyl 1,2-cyclic phosphodiesterase
LINHAKYLHEYAKAGIPIITSAGTVEKLNLSVPEHRSGYWYQFGGFNITPFRVEHDCAEPFGFLIMHDEIGTMLFATDTQYIRYDFSNLRLNHIMIECNYSDEIIKQNVAEGRLNESLKNRIIKSHMSLNTCKDFVINNSSSALDNVVLLHLSDGNSNEKEFKKEISRVIGTGTNVFIADKGLSVDLNIVPW